MTPTWASKSRSADANEQVAILGGKTEKLPHGISNLHRVRNLTVLQLVR